MFPQNCHTNIYVLNVQFGHRVMQDMYIFKSTAYRSLGGLDRQIEMLLFTPASYFNNLPAIVWAFSRSSTSLMLKNNS
ncbi:MAG: hypothetical protein ABFD04_08390, partial [Syntrophomonas sp.]